MFRTERFRDREFQLDLALHPKKMEALWKSHVRSSLRSQSIKDLHDDYDFQLNLKNRIKSIRTSVLQGSFQPSRPIRMRSEKRMGMSRHIVLLNPDDALVLESIADFIFPIIKKAQPTSNAYFSRNHSMPNGPADLDDNFGYPWWILWPQFQDQILKFSKNRKTIVTTDVANYYDNIDFQKLRNFLASLGEISEVLLDFIFYLFERFVWRPDYLPFPGKGLPQINLDAPRLVAHAFLFEIDVYIDGKSKGDFVRWLDDIDFGCEDKIEAQKMLRSIDELLLSRGLHLNSSKTKILTQKQAFEYFQLAQNRYLTILQKRIKRRIDGKKDIIEENKKLRKRFRKFLQKDKIGHWNKVLKRFFTVAGTCDDSFLEKYVSDLLTSQPALRPAIFRYYQKIGWSSSRERQIVDFLVTSLDDDGFFGAIEVLLNWIPEQTPKYILRMRALAEKIASEKPIEFLAALWLMAKFGSGEHIDKLINQYIHVWRANDWLARQVVSLWPRMKSTPTRNTVKNVIVSFGLTRAKAVLDNYELIGSHKNIIKRKVRPYIRALMRDSLFPVHKCLISLAVLNGSVEPSMKNLIKKDLLKIVKDPIYRYLSTLCF